MDPTVHDILRNTQIEHKILRLEAAEEVCARLIEEARQAVETDGAEVIGLGCAGMAGLEEGIRAATGVPVIDGVRAAVALVQSLVSTGVRTSKRNLYRPVERRSGAGLSAGIALGYERECSV